MPRVRRSDDDDDRPRRRRRGRGPSTGTLVGIGVGCLFLFLVLGAVVVYALITIPNAKAPVANNPEPGARSDRNFRGHRERLPISRLNFERITVGDDIRLLEEVFGPAEVIERSRWPQIMLTQNPDGSIKQSLADHMNRPEAPAVATMYRWTSGRESIFFAEHTSGKGITKLYRSAATNLKVLPLDESIVASDLIRHN